MDKIYEGYSRRRKAVVWKHATGFRAQLYSRSNPRGRWLQSGEVNTHDDEVRRALAAATNWLYDEATK